MSATTLTLRTRAARLVASLCGLGHVPFAPGTVASLVAVATAVGLMRWTPVALPEGVLAATIVGLVATEWSGHADRDSGWIVIDEFAGQWLAMATLPRVSAIGCLLAFALFRLLDITKPGPIGAIDRRHNAGAVMGDDVTAGAVVAGLLWAAQLIWPRLL